MPLPVHPASPLFERRQGLGVTQNNDSFMHLAELAMALDESLTDPKSLSFEITRYDQEADAGADGVSESESESDYSSLQPLPPPPPGDDANSEASWPSMRFERCSRTSERRSERFSERFSERSSGGVEPLLPPLLPPSRSFGEEELQEELNRVMLQLPSRKSPPPRVRRLSSEQHGESPVAALDDVLARRDAAATVLTSGRAGLPALPTHLARDLLDAAAPIAPSLADFARVSKVEVAALLRAAEIDVSCRRLSPEHADVLAWLMRRSLRACLVWGSAPASVVPLLSLDASGNELGPRGAAALGHALPAAPSLRSLRLNECLLCSAGGTNPEGVVEVRVLRPHLCAWPPALLPAPAALCGAPPGFLAQPTQHRAPAPSLVPFTQRTATPNRARLAHAPPPCHSAYSSLEGSPATRR